MEDRKPGVRAYVVLASGLVPAELASDFGQAPGGLLPVGGRAAVQHILDDLPDEALVVVTGDPDEPLVQLLTLDVPGIAFVPVSPEAPLLEAARAAVTHAVRAGIGDVTIVFSDTLCTVDLPPDSCAVQRGVTSTFRYTCAWTRGDVLSFDPVGAVKESEDVCVGVFRLADGQLFLDCSSAPGVDFYAGLEAYHLRRPLGLEPVEEWADLGHLSSFYRHRRHAFQARHFNELRLTAEGFVRKASPANPEKITQEIAWYQSLGPQLSRFVPRFFPVDHDPATPTYDLEYQALPTLGEQLVFGRLSADFWEEVFTALDTFLDAMWSTPVPRMSPRISEATKASVYVDKTIDRFRVFKEAIGTPGVLSACRHRDRFLDGGTGLVVATVAAIEATDLLEHPRWTVIHGDLFPGNMFYDRRHERLICIDPKGSFGIAGIHGDLVYDLAKLSHSFRGAYDFIVAGHSRDRLALQRDQDLSTAWIDRQMTPVAETFARWMARWCERLGVEERTVDLVEGSLFLSMLPLHSEDARRQSALLDRAVDAFDRAGVVEAQVRSVERRRGAGGRDLRPTERGVVQGV